MKKIVVVFPRARYCSDATGAVQVSVTEEKVLSLLGSADNLRCELTTYGSSSTTARIQVTLSEGTKAEMRPGVNIFAGVSLADFPSGSPPSAPQLGAVITQVNGPFGGLVDASLRVWDTAVSPTAVWVEAELRVTLLFN
jgi:hypothetical protein